MTIPDDLPVTLFKNGAPTLAALVSMAAYQILMRWRDKAQLTHAASAEVKAVEDQAAVRTTLMDMVKQQGEEIVELRDRLDSRDKLIDTLRDTINRMDVELRLCKEARERMERADLNAARRLHRAAIDPREPKED